jgi:hypothetical protein
MSQFPFSSVEDEPLRPEIPPLGEGLTEVAHWVTEPSEDPTFPEGAWSEHTAEITGVTRPGYRYEVRYGGSYWRAVPLQPLIIFEEGDMVSVVGRRGNELVISPMPEPAPAL